LIASDLVDIARGATSPLVLEHHESRQVPEHGPGSPATDWPAAGWYAEKR